MSEFGKRIVAAYQNKIGLSLGARDGEALQAFNEAHPDADPLIGEQAVAEAARQGKHVGMAYVLAIAERLLAGGGKQAPRKDDWMRTDEFIRWYKAKQRERGQVFTEEQT